MPSGTYYRKQAQLFVRLANASTDPDICVRYQELALDHLARAEEVEPTTGHVAPGMIECEGSIEWD